MVDGINNASLKADAQLNGIKETVILSLMNVSEIPAGERTEQI